MSHRSGSSRRRLLLSAVGVLLAGLAGLAAGCGGPSLSRVSGKVTFAGKPVPGGKIYFSPDGTKGNTGTSGFADIVDGRYDTSAAGGQGASGGPVVVRIEGTDGDKALFVSYEVSADLPRGTGTMDFDVPQAAAAGLPKNPGPQP